MMEKQRDVGEKVKYYKKIIVEEIGVKEELIFVNHSIENKQILVGTILYNSNNEIIRQDSVMIQKEDYDYIMSDYSTFEEGKQLGEFRTSDLWLLLDKIRGD